MVLSIVLSLTDTASSMQVAGYDEIMYQGSGSASCFLSNATHRSGFAERGTKKIAFFFGLESKMDTYETYPKIVRAPLPSLPLFYDKKSDCQKVGCFCLHNHVLVEKSDFLTAGGSEDGMNTHYLSEGAASELRIGLWLHCGLPGLPSSFFLLSLTHAYVHTCPSANPLSRIPSPTVSQMDPYSRAR